MNVPAPAPISEVSRLNRYRIVADRVAADTWRLEKGFGKQWIVAHRFDGTEQVICDLNRNARRDEIAVLADALDMLTFFLPMFDRAAKRTRALVARVERLEAELAEIRGEVAADESAPDRPDDEAGDRPKNYSAQASMLLTDALFQRFLSEVMGGEVIDSEELADAALKEQLGITSKKQINAEDGARASFLDLRARFSAWKQGNGA